MVKRSFFILVGLLLLLPTQVFAQAQVQASVDQNPITMGDSVVLTVSVNADVANNAFDPSILDQNFIVGRTSISRSTQVVNFSSTKETNWQVLLLPKHQGKLVIPAFNIAGELSTPITLDVLKSGTKTAQTQAVFLKATISSHHAYVGQLLTYKVKLYLGKDLLRGVINAPLLTDSDIQQLGEDLDKIELINGKRYRVIERTYGIIPQHAGTVNIQGATFNGDIAADTDQNFGMFGFNSSKPVQAIAPQVQLEVKAQPADYKGQWLVADMLHIQQKMDHKGDYQVGNPITRTITLTAVNADDASLADITVPAVTGIKNYPEKPTRQTAVREQKVIAQLSQIVAMVPTKAGTYTLPEIKVPWWNPHLNKQQFATLPAQTITVKQGDAPLIPQVTAQSAAQVTTPTVTKPQTNESIIVENGIWPWVSLVFAILWLVTLALWIRACRQQTKVPTTPAPVATQADLNQLKQNWLQACKQQQVGASLMALQQYLSQLHQEQLSLAQIAAQSPQLEQAITELQAQVYAKTQVPANFDVLISAVNDHVNNKLRTQGSTLQPLNP